MNSGKGRNLPDADNNLNNEIDDAEGHAYKIGMSLAGEGDLEARQMISVDGDPTAEDTEGHAYRSGLQPAEPAGEADTEGHAYRGS